MTETLEPGDAEGVLEAVVWAVAGETPLEAVGGGPKRALGRPVEAAHPLEL